MPAKTNAVPKPAPKTKPAKPKASKPKGSAPKAARSAVGPTKPQDHEVPSPKEIANDAHLAAWSASTDASAKAPKQPKPATEPKPKRVSALDAAAQVLAASPTPMRAKDMIAQMEARGLWKSPGGKTPEATLYAAIVRDIKTKKKESRFAKVDRGFFAAAKGA